MSNKENDDKNKKWIVAMIFCLAVGVAVFGLAYYTTIVQGGIQKSELPLDKLNQGYDLVCLARDHMELCVYNQTSRTTVNPDLKLGMEDFKTKKTNNVDLYEIDKVKKNYCIKELDINLGNMTSGCNEGKGFPKDTWTVSLTSGTNGNENMIEFRNYTK